ncbi:hypothetical protein BDV19DRAFT_379457 [Aspergillus venezuelensis]
MPQPSDPAITCAEYIALASLFHSIPVVPSSSIPTSIPRRNYTLAFEQERNLARTLAFLAHIKGDSEYVPACFADGDDVLYDVERGFKELFELLDEVPIGGSSSDVRSGILNIVVSMCSLRILSRLRLARSGWKKPKRCFKDTLMEVTLALRNMNQDRMRERGLLDTVNKVSAEAKRARKAVDACMQYEAPERLVEIVESIHQLQRIKQLPDDINLIPNICMNPSARESFLNIVGKTIQLARRMKAIPVRLVQTDAQSQYNRQVKNTLKQSKLYAEVQLIAYLELQPLSLRPRVICWSKDASFLCNLLVKVYGKIRTPRSHGVLYPAWRLPRLPELHGIAQRFNKSLRAEFEKSLTMILSTRRKILHPKPVESTLLPPFVSGTNLSGSGTVSHAQTSEIGMTANEGPDSRPSLHDLSYQPQSSIEAPKANAGTDSRAILLQACVMEGTVRSGEKSVLYSTGPLEIIIERCTEPGSTTTCSYQLEWLDNGETEALQLRDEGRLVNAEGIKGEVTLLNRKPVYLAVRGLVLRLSWTCTNI